MDHLMVHGPQRSGLLLFTTLLIQGVGEVLPHQSISRLVACVVVFDYKQKQASLITFWHITKKKLLWSV